MYYLFYHTEIIEGICRRRIIQIKPDVILALQDKSTGMTSLWFDANVMKSYLMFMITEC